MADRVLSGRFADHGLPPVALLERPCPLGLRLRARRSLIHGRSPLRVG
ncbi:MAG: hypothetical protein BIP78_1093 [Candidatus Bipolaricaulis sibiricus]|uniref:Uncharacterized protein n=1 Tax=Bipolaricaulis sibiricus TaxID=2501609 RepID=A0A410FUU5_BIPS1|nr:MAG: hypothetical protein BIP78_1093 [Candidatus Bipolaricaulis sibiricus]